MYQVIIVDDEPRILEGIIHLFPWNNFGFEVVASFTNGKEALEYINAHPQVDIVMTDIQMPVMTGQELCQAIHAEMPDRSFPIFVMTSMTDREHREWTAEIPRLQLLEKPLSMRILMQKFDQVFGAAD